MIEKKLDFQIRIASNIYIVNYFYVTMRWFIYQVWKMALRYNIKQIVAVHIKK